MGNILGVLYIFTIACGPFFESILWVPGLLRVKYGLAYALMIGSFEELHAESKRNNTERYVLQTRELPND